MSEPREQSTDNSYDVADVADDDDDNDDKILQLVTFYQPPRREVCRWPRESRVLDIGILCGLYTVCIIVVLS